MLTAGCTCTNQPQPAFRLLHPALQGLFEVVRAGALGMGSIGYATCSPLLMDRLGSGLGVRGRPARFVCTRGPAPCLHARLHARLPLPLLPRPAASSCPPSPGLPFCTRAQPPACPPAGWAVQPHAQIRPSRGGKAFHFSDPAEFGEQAAPIWCQPRPTPCPAPPASAGQCCALSPCPHSSLLPPLPARPSCRARGNRGLLRQPVCPAAAGHQPAAGAAWGRRRRPRPGCSGRPRGPRDAGCVGSSARARAAPAPGAPALGATLPSGSRPLTGGRCRAAGRACSSRAGAAGLPGAAGKGS